MFISRRPVLLVFFVFYCDCAHIEHRSDRMMCCLVALSFHHRQHGSTSFFNRHIQLLGLFALAMSTMYDLSTRQQRDIPQCCYGIFDDLLFCVVYIRARCVSHCSCRVPQRVTQSLAAQLGHVASAMTSRFTGCVIVAPTRYASPTNRSSVSGVISLLCLQTCAA